MWYSLIIIQLKSSYIKLPFIHVLISLQVLILLYNNNKLLLFLLLLYSVDLNITIATPVYNITRHTHCPMFTSATAAILGNCYTRHSHQSRGFRQRLAPLCRKQSTMATNALSPWSLTRHQQLMIILPSFFNTPLAVNSPFTLSKVVFAKFNINERIY